jgi:poly-beta-1,6-N-acetyl-D-glucosamine synthase
MRNLLELDYPAERIQIVVVSDGSTDRTDAILREHASDARVQVVMNQLSRGKASGLNDAMELVQGDVVVFSDARQKIELGALRLLMENFADPEVGGVSGELMLGDPESGEAAEGVGLYWRIEKQIRILEGTCGSVIGATGALYAVRRELLTALPAGTILDDVYIPMQVAKQGKRVVFERRARAWDSPNGVGQREFYRKVRTLGGNYQLLQLAPWLLSRENPVRFEFVSHKLLRLLVPFAMVGLLVSSVVLEGPFYRACLWAQAGFYALSLLAFMHVRLGILGRVADPAKTLVVLNVAALVAFTKFITGRKTAW